MHSLDPDRWESLWRRLFTAGDPTPVYRQLQALYAEPARYYHNASHIVDCLREFDSPLVTAADPGALELALWFHDAIYDPKANDNEARSSALARACIADAGGAIDLSERVRGLILATKAHDPGCSADAPWMIDIDLSIFGRSEAEFDAYDSAIRAEYSWVGEPVFRERRAQILEEFLARPRIFTTAPFRTKYETTARANLRRSIARLRPPSH